MAKSEEYVHAEEMAKKCTARAVKKGEETHEEKYARPTTQRTGGPPIPKRRFHVQWVHIGMQGGGVCIRKISGSIEVTSGSAPKML